MSTRLRRVILLGLGVLALTFAWAGSARAVTIAPPWCGRPSPTRRARCRTEAIRPTRPAASRTSRTTRSGARWMPSRQRASTGGCRCRSSVIPPEAARCTSSRSTSWPRTTSRRTSRTGRRSAGTRSTDPAKAQTRLGKNERLQDPDLHPERDPRKRVRGRRRDDAPDQQARDDPVRDRSGGRSHPRPRDRRLQHRPEPGRTGRGHERPTATASTSTATS